MQAAATNGTVFVTFTNRELGAFALNWARQLKTIGVRSLVGTVDRIGAALLEDFRHADAHVFCADRVGLMSRNGQAGRWAEAALVLKLARELSLSVLLSDADIAWMRNPVPYFHAAKAAHPRIDLLMMTDRAFNGYSSSPLPGQPVGRARGTTTSGRRLGSRQLLRHALGLTRTKSVTGIDLELEPGYESSISYNIGVIWFCHHAMDNLEAMLHRWVTAVGGGNDDGGGGGGGGHGARGSPGGKPAGRAARTAINAAGGGKLAAWDQEPINKQVLQQGLAPDLHDRRLVRVDRGRLVMGVLPMLQFTTAFTYHMFHRRRADLGVAPPYCLHAIFAHGKDVERKISIFREEGLWHDPPEYYEPPGGGRFLVAEPSVHPALLARGGFDIIHTQLRQVQQAFKLAALLNRTLILPRLRCGDRPMAYPCYAWYHRAMAYFGPNPDKVAMPEVCPLYYWLDVHRLRSLPVLTREPGFLENERTPRRLREEVARVHLCPGGGVACADGAGSAPNTEQSGAAAVRVPGSAPAAHLRKALAPVSRARVLKVQHLQWLRQPEPSHLEVANAEPSSLISTARLDPLTKGFWCTACPITRRGAVIHELNRSVVRELETFCKTEARARLGMGLPQRSCCPRPDSRQAGACHECRPSERRTLNETSLPWTTAAWLPMFAHLELSRSTSGEWPRCAHPLCTGDDRAHFP